jgi:hypothetical protein
MLFVMCMGAASRAPALKSDYDEDVSQALAEYCGKAEGVADGWRGRMLIYS